MWSSSALAGCENQLRVYGPLSLQQHRYGAYDTSPVVASRTCLASSINEPATSAKLTGMCALMGCVGRVDPLRGEGAGRRLVTLRSSDQDPRMCLADASAAWSTDLDGSQPDPWRYLLKSETDDGADIVERR
jgi:hypothetical protein